MIKGNPLIPKTYGKELWKAYNEGVRDRRNGVPEDARQANGISLDSRKLSTAWWSGWTDTDEKMLDTAPATCYSTYNVNHERTTT